MNNTVTSKKVDAKGCFNVRFSYIAAPVLLLLPFLWGCASQDFSQAGVDPAEYEAFTTSKVNHADDLQVVDCLLPGRVQKLGKMVYMTARRPIKTSAAICEIRGGEYIAFDRADLGTALSIWLPLADGGDAKAQTYVGEMYEKGLGTAPNYEKAASWYEKAAAQGSSRAKINLGNLYEKGLGVEKDEAKALNLYREASGLSQSIVIAEEDLSKEEREELSRLRREIEASADKSERLEKELAQTKQQLRSTKDDLNSQEKAMAQLQQDIDGRRASIGGSAAGDPQIVRLNSSLVEKEAELEALRENVARLSRKALVLEGGAGGQDAAAFEGPSIKIIEPMRRLATRGVSVVQASQNLNAQEIIGKVDSPVGVYRLTLNDAELKTEDDGFFRVSVPVLDPGDPPFRFVAVDNFGKVASLDFMVSGRPVMAMDELKKKQAAALASPKTLPEVDFGEFYALIIGNGDYQHYPKLAGSVRDAEDISQMLLRRYGFQTTVLKDVGRLEILSSIHQFGSSLPVNSNLLIYYAGHGEIDPVNNRGFWIPVDAKKDDRANWLSTESLTDLLNLMKVRRVLVVADSCYSGVLSESSVASLISGDLKGDELDRRMEAIAAKRSRTVLTSGGLKPVLDQGGGDNSVFADSLLGILGANADILEARRLSEEVSARVSFVSEDLGLRQDPEYAALRHAGHEAGDFFFVPR
jgi:hypothetical protein